MSKRLAKLYSAELEGIQAKPIEVEVDINVGLHSFNIVGLADKALTEARERVNSALKNSGIKPPTRENRKITVNLAPADVKKTGSHYDLAIALGYLIASGQIAPFETKDALFVGELSLAGELRPVSGALAFAQLAKRRGYRRLFLPAANAAEAGIVKGISVFPVRILTEIILHLENKKMLTAVTADFSPSAGASLVDISEVKGQAHAKRALTIAAAGSHNMLMIGPPGSGKSMLAQALNSILPPLTLEEALEVTAVWSAAGLNEAGVKTVRPFRAPHQSASLVAVIGGGTNPRPGEVSLAHRGVLFLDELPEFRRDLLEALRQPMESGFVHVARAKGTVTFPAKFTLISAMNPCPCGYATDAEHRCKCSAHEIVQYQKKLSGPLLDRIDLQLHVPRVPLEEIRKPRETEHGDKIRETVARARRAQEERFRAATPRVHTNAEMSAKQCDELIPLGRKEEEFLKAALEKAMLSARGYYRLLKTARTIADIEGAEDVRVPHLAEAFSYRLKDSN
ncbi:MAG: YifB family Mg chelatase-like AAA ATPase [bacterium]|nr:YifB family Mg chelatase-like AAA ATPase [bacterium]